MRYFKHSLVGAAALLVAAFAARADVLELKNGTILNGRYAGGSAGTVRFETSGGTQVLETSKIVALTFTTAAPTSSKAAAPAPTAAKTSSISLPVGTTLVVRLMDGISSKNPAGTKFTTKLEYDLSSGGAAALKGGTMIYGKVASSTQAGRALGKSTLDLRLTDIIVGGQPVKIMTGGYQQAGQASIAKAAKGAAAGAAIGAIAGDAGKGAAIGATAGALTKGQTITITPGTLLEFTLTQPVTIPVQ
jgi:hypothetical protein